MTRIQDDSRNALDYVEMSVTLNLVGMAGDFVVETMSLYNATVD
jgi:hypothetical protein